MPPRLALCACAALLATAPGAFAQEYSPVRWSMMGGANPPVGQTADLLQTGWDLGFAVTWREPGHPLGLRLDFNYAANNATRHTNAGALFISAGKSIRITLFFEPIGARDGE